MSEKEIKKIDEKNEGKISGGVNAGAPVKVKEVMKDALAARLVSAMTYGAIGPYTPHSKKFLKEKKLAQNAKEALTNPQPQSEEERRDGK